MKKILIFLSLFFAMFTPVALCKQQVEINEICSAQQCLDTYNSYTQSYGQDNIKCYASLLQGNSSNPYIYKYEAYSYYNGVYFMVDVNGAGYPVTLAITMPISISFRDFTSAIWYLVQIAENGDISPMNDHTVMPAIRDAIEHGTGTYYSQKLKRYIIIGYKKKDGVNFAMVGAYTE